MRTKTSGTSGIVNGKPMVQIQISRQPNANIVDTVARIKALMPQFEAQLPPTVRFKIASDRTITIRDSMAMRSAT